MKPMDVTRSVLRGCVTGLDMQLRWTCYGSVICARLTSVGPAKYVRRTRVSLPVGCPVHAGFGCAIDVQRPCYLRQMDVSTGAR